MPPDLQGGSERGRAFVGQTGSGLIVVGDFRDVIANGAIIYKTGGEDGKLDLTFAAIGIFPGAGDAAKAAKPFAPEVIDALQKFVGKFGEEGLALLKQSVGDSPERLRAMLESLLRRSDEEGILSITATKLGGFDGALTKDRINGIDVDVISVEDGKGLLNHLGFTKLDDLQPHEKGAIGEKLADQLAKDRGWTSFSSPKPSTTPGVDSVYKDANGNIVVLEVKFTSSDKNVGTGMLGTRVTDPTNPDVKIPQTQLATGWLGDGDVGAIQRAVEAKTITQAQADEILAAIANGTLKREAIIVRNGDSGAVTRGLGDHADLAKHPSLGPITVTQINLGTVIK